MFVSYHYFITSKHVFPTLILIKKYVCVCVCVCLCAFFHYSVLFHLCDLYISFQRCCAHFTQKTQIKRIERKKAGKNKRTHTYKRHDALSRLHILQRCSHHSHGVFVCAMCFCKINDDTKVKKNGSPNCDVYL